MLTFENPVGFWAFAETEFGVVFSGYQPRQVSVLNQHQSLMMMTTKMVFETSVQYGHLTRPHQISESSVNVYLSKTCWYFFPNIFWLKWLLYHQRRNTLNIWYCQKTTWCECIHLATHCNTLLEVVRRVTHNGVGGAVVMSFRLFVSPRYLTD